MANGYQLCDEVKRCVQFRQVNLLVDNPNIPVQYFDLIMCCNVLIYFTMEAKQRLYALFHSRMKKGSALFMGKAEQILSPEKYGFSKQHSWLYSINNESIL